MFGGGGFNSILMQRTSRVKRGYTYGAYSAFSFSQAPGTSLVLVMAHVKIN